MAGCSLLAPSATQNVGGPNKEGHGGMCGVTVRYTPVI